jgi:glycosyltransferase involved in cell wall biosynthesis
MRKVLFLAHYFPPTGGAGVQRSVKFVKYLPDFGWLPVVLTGSPKAPDRWTPEDASLAAEVPESVPVTRAQAVDENLPREARASAVRRALVEAGSKAIEEHRPALIFATMSPFDHCLVAAELAKRFNLPWVADLRDPWALDEFQVHRSRWHRARERRVMRERLSSAASIIMNTPEARRRLHAAFPELAAKAVVSITNGYDPTDFDVEPKVLFPGKFNIVHSGYFHADHGLRQRRRNLEYTLLGRTEPGVRLLPRSHYYLIKAFERWLTVQPAIREKVAMVCLGVASPVDQSLVDASSCASIFTFTGYKPHRECLQYVRGADLLFLPMHALPEKRRSSIVPGKTYEYLAANRPLLAAVPNGDARDFLREAGAADLCEPEDIEAMATALRKRFDEWSGRHGAQQREIRISPEFERKELALRLADEFVRVLGLQSG